MALFSWPICYFTKPSYRFDVDKNTYVGGTDFIDKWPTWFITIMGMVMGLSRMRDRLLRVKLYNMWMRATCRLNKQVKFAEF